MAHASAVPLPYYHRLSRREQAIYRKSDAVHELVLPDPGAHAGVIAAIAAGLAADDRGAVQRACRALVAQLCAELDVAAVIVRVLARRPASATEELHGLYEREDGAPAVIRVWMRTAANERAVAFRTFLRTLLHELCHHLDYERLGLADSFHTEGFFRRESSLVRQLAGPGRSRRRAAIEVRAPVDPPSPAELQLLLPGLD